MALVCPNCGGNTGHSTQCPACHVAASFIPAGSRQLQTSALGVGWQHTPAGRVFIGLVLAVGLALAFRHFLTAGLVALPAVDEEDVWSNLYGLLLRHGLEFACLLVACVIAGSGQSCGFFVGAAIGLMSGLVQLGIARLQQAPISDIDSLAGPLLSVFVGALGGLTGLLVWKPLPVVLLAPVVYKKKRRPDRIVNSFAGRVAWFRVLIGTAVVVVGAIFPTTILNFVVFHSQGQLQVSSPLQSTHGHLGTGWVVCPRWFRHRRLRCAQRSQARPLCRHCFRLADSGLPTFQPPVLVGRSHLYDVCLDDLEFGW
jgi:hypothetical protein